MARGRFTVPTPSHTSTWKVLPTPFSLFNPVSPSISSANRLTMVSPRPVPPCSRVVELSAWEKGLNIRSTWAGVMPMPVSSTAILSLTRSPSVARFSILTVTWPRSVNLTALLMRLLRIWPMRSGSPTKPCGTSGPTLMRSSRSFSETFCPTKVETLSSTSSSQKGTCSTVSLPASIFEKSRMSLMMPSNREPEWLIFWM